MLKLLENRANTEAQQNNNENSKYLSLIYGIDLFSDVRLLAWEFFTPEELKVSYCPTGFRNKSSKYVCLSQEKISRIIS
ncbi:hypothetical protein SNEBB_003233 [Seison nebaliae]|nr:hypothetical protein SNEBB_003233 [Seison nebaliae]